MKLMYSICVILFCSFFGVNIYQYSTGTLIKTKDITEVINFRDHEIGQQLEWALCYIDANSDDMKDEPFECADKDYADYFYRSVVGQMTASNIPELQFCAKQPDLTHIIVHIGEVMYVNVEKAQGFGITSGTAIPIATMEVCTEAYNKSKQNLPPAHPGTI